MDIFKKTSVSLSFARLRGSVTAVYWIMLIVVFILEGLVINDSVSIISQSFAAPFQVPTSQGVRVNFTLYDQALARVAAAQNFVPTDPPQQNPFYTKPAP